MSWGRPTSPRLHPPRGSGRSCTPCVGTHKLPHESQLPPFRHGHGAAASPRGSLSMSREEGLNRTGNLSPVSPGALRGASYSHTNRLLQQKENEEGSAHAATSSPDPSSAGATSLPLLKPWEGSSRRMESVVGCTLHPHPKAAPNPWGSRDSLTSLPHPWPFAPAQLVPLLAGVQACMMVLGGCWGPPHQTPALLHSLTSHRPLPAPAHQHSPTLWFSPTAGPAPQTRAHVDFSHAGTSV